jgi:hypothetical protein
MPADLFTLDNLSIEALHATFEAAMFDAAVDNDGDLVVNDKYKMIVTIHGDDLIRLLCVFGVNEDAGEEAGNALCNRINDGLILIRASMHDATTLLLDWYLPVRGGIAKKAVVMAFRKFSDTVALVGQYDTDDIIE